jgi:hypothetical protein
VVEASAPVMSTVVTSSLNLFFIVRRFAEESRLFENIARNLLHVLPLDRPAIAIEKGQ